LVYLRLEYLVRLHQQDTEVTCHVASGVLLKCGRYSKVAYDAIVADTSSRES